MSEFYRFPHTPHLRWLGKGQPRDDKVLAPEEADAFLAREIMVEEKVDGANLGFSVDAVGQLQAQNRGHYLALDRLEGQWRPLARWLAGRGDDLAAALFPNLILYGEWCTTVHSIRYTRLPDWFLGFDVLDRERDAFWSAARRDEFAAGLGVTTVARVGAGRFTVAQLLAMMQQSRYRDGPAEGLYLRQEAEGQLVARTKIVRPEFVQAIDEHWSKRAMDPNTLAAGN